MLRNRVSRVVHPIVGRLALVGALCWPAGLVAQRGNPQADLIAQRNATEQKLESVAIIDRSVMVKMRDG